MFGESFFSSLLMPMLTVYLLRCTGEDWRRNTLLRIVGGLWLVYFALLIVTQFTTVIYTVTPDNDSRRGAWYPVLLIAPVLLMLLNLLALWRRRTKLTRSQTLAFALYLLIPMMEIISRDGDGTIVTVTIPDGATGQARPGSDG